MKKFLFISTFFCFTSSFVFATPTRWINCEKQYVNPAQIKLCEQGIFININNDYLRINNLQSDEYGVYFSQIGVGNELKLTFWKCDDCGAKNDAFDTVCKSCHSPKVEKDDDEEDDDQ